MIAETTVYTQMDVAFNQENIRQTVININSSSVSKPDSLYDMEIQITNNGSVSFGKSDYSKIDLFIYDGSTMNLYSISNTSNLKNDLINKGIWDPSEIIVIKKENLVNEPLWAKIVLPNGISISTNLPETT